MITSINIPNSVTNIGHSAFADCSSLTSIIIPDLVTRIGYYAFFGCSSLISVTIGNSVESIEENTFSYCTKLTSLKIPNSIVRIEALAFQESGLTTITIPNSVESLGPSLFYGCQNLSTVIIGNSVSYIPNSIFLGCNNLTTIEIDEGNKTYDSRNGCNAIIETSTNKLITGCKNTSIPSSIVSIERFAFERCPLTSVVIPNSVTSIGNYAFSECSGIREIHCYASAPPALGDDTFYGLSTNHVKLYVPKGCKDAYAFAKGWDAFLNIIEEEETAITLTQIDERYGDVEYYKLNGGKVDKPTQPGIYLVKKDGKTKMIVVKK